MAETIWLIAAGLVAGIYLLLPALVRTAYRFAVKRDPQPITLEELPADVATLFRARVPEVRALGFELVGYYDCGALVAETYSFVAYFVDSATNDIANITVMIAPGKTQSYLEFSTRFSDGSMIETNTNGDLPLSPPDTMLKVFRFPSIRDPRVVLRLHHLLVEKYAAELRAEGECHGQEIQRFVRVLQNYGPRHARIGYMQPAKNGEFYTLTWKGAFLMTWRGMWPAAPVRRFMNRQAMRSELHTLETPTLPVLQKA